MAEAYHKNLRCLYDVSTTKGTTGPAIPVAI